MSRDPSARRWAMGALVVLALVAGGCGSGAVDGPGEDADGSSDEAGADDGGEVTPTTAAASDQGGGSSGNGGEDGGGSGNGGGGGGGEGDRYSWGLPGGDLSLDGSVTVYNALLLGCAEGRTELDIQDSATSGESVIFWPGHRVALYRAAIAACEGDRDAARGFLASAAVTTARGDCTVYQRTLSVVDQRDPADITCPAPRALGPHRGGVHDLDRVDHHDRGRDDDHDRRGRDDDDGSRGGGDGGG